MNHHILSPVIVVKNLQADGGNNRRRVSPLNLVQRAFTLVEMLVVIAIIGLLLAVAAPSILGSLNASQLSAAGSGLVYKLSLAQQLAISKKQPVEIRFYTYTYTGVSAVRGYQLFAQTDPAVPATVKALEGPVYFGDGSVVISPSNILSPMLQAAGIAATEEPWASKPGANTTYRKVIFYPDGSTNLLITLPQAFFTLIGEKALNATTTPPNYYTVQLDPVTGRTRSYRP